jgi:tRNA uridine 5-carbamoylmethylation protein Kti12
MGLNLCTECIQGLEEIERARVQEEAEKIRAIVEGVQLKPSLIADLYIHAAQKGLKLVFKTNPEKRLDYTDSNVAPLIHLLSEDEIVAFLAIVEKEYFLLKSALNIRRINRKEEAEVLKHQRKVEKTREKATKEVEKQRKHASKDKTLSPQERLTESSIQNMMKLLKVDYETAKKVHETTMKGKK